MFRNNNTITKKPQVTNNFATAVFQNETITKYILMQLSDLEQIRVQSVCKNFNQVINSNKLNIYKAAENNLVHIQTVEDYHHFITRFPKQLKKSSQPLKENPEQVNENSDKIDEEQFKGLVEKTDKVRDSLLSISENSCGGYMILATCAAFGALFAQENSTENYHKLWDNCTEFANQCQTTISQNLWHKFFFYMLLGTASGFFGKGLETLINSLILCFTSTRIAPSLDSSNPSSNLNKSIYTSWRVLQFKELGIFTSAGILLAFIIDKINDFPLEASHACNAKNDTSDTINCLNNIIESTDIKSFAIAEGFLFGFSLIATLIFAYKMLEKMVSKFKNTHTTNPNLLFSPSINASLDKMEEQPLLSQALK